MPSRGSPKTRLENCLWLMTATLRCSDGVTGPLVQRFTRSSPPSSSVAVMPDYRADPQVVPYLMYEDAGAAMDWLIRMLGFTERARVRQSDGAVRHGELLTDGGGVIMVGSPGGGFRGPAKLGEVTQLQCIT